MEAREDREARRDARLYALLCNLRGGKKTWTEADFYRGREEEAAVPDQESEEARQALEAYRAWVGRKGTD